MANKNFSLEVWYSHGGPAGDWRSRIEFDVVSGGIRVREWIGDDPVRDRGILRGTPTWRRAALYLARRNEIWCLPGHALDDVQIRGCAGWRGELLAVCWCRFGEEKEWNFGRHLASLQDRQLAALWRDYGSVLGFRARRQLLSDMETLVLLLMDTELEPSFEGLGGFRLLIERREPALKPGFLKRIISAIEREAEELGLVFRSSVADGGFSLSGEPGDRYPPLPRSR
jgi:hypothetical protein